jgi:hypothetical protein
MLSLDLLAEQRIAEAMARGDFDDLPGQGEPLRLDDDPLVPEDLRVAYRILRNAGYVPPEVESLRAVSALEQLIDSTPDNEQRRSAILRLQLLRTQLERSRPGRSAATLRPHYHGRILARLRG